MTTAEAPTIRQTGIHEAMRQDEDTTSPYRSSLKAHHFRDLSRLISKFDPISLDEMDQVALLDRTDTKYVMSTRQLYHALASLAEDYRVLEVAGVRLNSYRTLYFDTGDFSLYRSHHSGKRVRYKVRSREYVDTGLTFLEIKSKAKRDRTVKARIRTNGFVTEWPAALEEVEGSGIRIETGVMKPMVSNSFYRITLVGKRLRERVTLDLGLEFSASWQRYRLPEIAIGEVKQDGLNRDSAFVRQMKTAGIRPSGFSKYCLGVSLLYEDVKHNRFKPTLRLINKLERDGYDAE